MAERKSIGTVHVFRKEQEDAPGGWYLETRHAYSEAVGDSRQPDWDGPPPRNSVPLCSAGSPRHA